MREPITHDRSTIALLTNLGLSKHEVRCYLASLALGPAPVRAVAARAGIHRVHAYRAIASLATRGLVEQEIAANGRRSIRPAPLAHLEEIAQDAQRQATKLRWRIANLIPTLAATSASGADAPSVALGDILYLRGEDAFYRIADRMLASPKESTMDIIESYDYFSTPENPTYDDEHFIPTRIARGIRARVLHRHDAYAERLRSRDGRELRETRFLPPEINFPGSIYCYGTEVAFLWTTESVSGFVVRGGPLVALMRVVFGMTWEIASTRTPTRRSRSRTVITSAPGRAGARSMPTPAPPPS